MHAWVKERERACACLCLLVEIQSLVSLQLCVMGPLGLRKRSVISLLPMQTDIAQRNNVTCFRLEG